MTDQVNCAVSYRCLGKNPLLRFGKLKLVNKFVRKALFNRRKKKMCAVPDDFAFYETNRTEYAMKLL